MITEAKKAEIRNRIAMRISICDRTGCWIWPKNHVGYPVMRVNGKAVLVRRYALASFQGEPGVVKINDLEGKRIESTCGNINCVNPAHLTLSHYGHGRSHQPKGVVRRGK